MQPRNRTTMLLLRRAIDKPLRVAEIRGSATISVAGRWRRPPRRRLLRFPRRGRPPSGGRPDFARIACQCGPASPVRLREKLEDARTAEPALSQRVRRC